jgi:hypothetical protein
VRGRLGTYVTLFGASLFGFFNGVACVYCADVLTTIVSAFDIVIIVRLGNNSNSTVNILIVGNNDALNYLKDAFEVLDAGIILAVSPKSGQFGIIVANSGVFLITSSYSIFNVTLSSQKVFSIISSNTVVMIV